MSSLDQTCSRCGARLPSRLLDGLCEVCLLRFSLGVGGPPPLADDAAGASLFDLLEPSLPATARIFGDYELLEEIGAGGMGVVWRGRQRSLNRLVAVKMIRAGQLARPDDIRRFRTEAEAVARLQHPGIVAIHEIGEVDGQHFFSMELVEGASLAQITHQAPLPPRRAAMLVQAIAATMHHAHSRGVLHRDLKPSNILFDANDQPHVTDFGLAKVTGSASDVTSTNAIVGSPSYMAPEQASGHSRDVDGRADLHALGAILYELLTGRPPFQADSAMATLKLIVEAEPVPPQQLNPQIPRDLETICLKCLEKESDKRYATAQELAEDLGRFLRNEPIHARPVSRVERAWRWCRRKPALAGSLAAVAILLLAMLIGSPIAIYRINQARNAEAAERQSAQTEAARAEAEALKARQARDAEAAERKRAQTEATRAEAEALNASQARDAEAVERQRAQNEAARAEAEALKARQLAYASDMNRAHQAVQADEFHEALRLLDRHRPEFVVPASAGSASDRSLAHPDRLKAGLQTDLRGWEWRYLWRQCQGEQRFILGKHTYGASAVGMLADGKTVFSAGSDKFVHLWDFESRRQTGMLPHSAAITGAAASADGRWLATATSKDAKGQPVLLWDLATQKIAHTLTTNFWLKDSSITFSPDSKWLAFATMFGGLRIWDVNSRTEVTNLLSIDDGSPGPLGVAFSPDSRTLAYNENVYGAILLWDIASRSTIGALNGHESFVRALAFSPDGQMLASGSHDRTARLWNLAERREVLQPFTNHSGAFKSLAFSPDGRTLAMSGAGGAGRVIRLVEIETGKPKAELRGHLEDVTSLAFTPDGQTLLSASEDGTIRVWDVLPRAKEKSVHEFVRNSINSDWRSYGPALCLSPDGRHLLTVYTNQTFSLWDTLRLAEGERHPVPFTNTAMAAVAPGGRLAAFGSRSGELMLWDVETGQARFFPRPETNHIHLLAFSPDGRYLAADYDTKTPSQMSVGYQKRTVRVWDVGTRKETRVFDTDGQFPVSLKFSDDAKALAAGFWEGPVKLWQLDEPGGAADFIGHSGVVAGLAMSANGQTLISTGPDIRFWDVRTRQENALKLSPRSTANCVALSPDGRRLAAGAEDGRITIWDLASHEEVATLEGHKEWVTQLAFTPDGDHLVSASKDQLRVWSAASHGETDAPTKLNQ